MPTFSAVAKVKMVLQLWTKMALNVRMRDRSVKVLQYGCQMLMGYYGSQLQEATHKSLATLRRASSSSRKAFWLLKSLNHLGTMIDMVQGGFLNAERPIEDKLDFVEQIFLVLYYWYESEIYFARAGMFGLDEDIIDPWCNWTWLGGDLAFFFSCLVRLKKHVELRTELSKRLLDASQRDGDQVCGDLCIVAEEHAQSPGLSYSVSQVKGEGVRVNGVPEMMHGDDGDKLSPQVSEKIAMLIDLHRMDEKTFDKGLALAISILELGVSLHYCDFYKAVFGEHLSETYVGAMGVASSVLILYEGLLGYRREISAQA